MADISFDRITFDADGELDEVVMDAGCHLERIEPDQWILEAHSHDGSSLCVRIEGSVTITERPPLWGDPREVAPVVEEMPDADA